MKEKKPTNAKPPEKKPVKPATPRETNVSIALANLLRKEGFAADRVKKAQDDLKAIQADIQKMWDARNEQAADLLDEILED